MTVVRSSGIVSHPTPNDIFTTEVRCETGEVATGWGFRGDTNPKFFGSLRHALPIPDTPGATPTGFTFVVSSGTQLGQFEGFVLCARPGPSL